MLDSRAKDGDKYRRRPKFFGSKLVDQNRTGFGSSGLARLLAPLSIPFYTDWAVRGDRFGAVFLLGFETVQASSCLKLGSTRCCSLVGCWRACVDRGCFKGLNRHPKNLSGKISGPELNQIPQSRARKLGLRLLL